ncbi:MAG TPA: glycosyltransferase family 2 protein [Candidatus Baltobacteraceae bacterium]|jgi:glycosyltransferase involved in cell wall biosynthesis|nr:glycosyltransferase family 2 protein [Candidatus Baltobacteraceae bacterium]
MPPLISVVVATLNEERHIGRILDQMLAQEGLDGDLEILVADGGSSDRTREIVASYANGGKVGLIENPRRHHVYGFNLALRAARGSIVCLIGGHASFPSDYLARCMAVKRRTGAANVGGVIRHQGEGAIGEAIALAMASPIGVGDAKFRRAKREQPCESVMGLFCDRRIFDEIGYFNETSIVNQDGEFNYRLRAAGYTVLVSPEIGCTYFVRPSIAALARQYYRYGFYRRWTEVQHPGSVPWRVYAPPLLLAVLAVSAALTAVGRYAAGLAFPVLYAIVLAVAATDGLRRSKKPAVAVLEPLAVATMHLSFGAGWIHGLLVHRKPPAVGDRSTAFTHL